MGATWRELLQQEGKAKQARRRKEQEEQAKDAERQEKQLLREIEAEDARARVDPPPQLPPQELKERELVERLDRLEGNPRLSRFDLAPASTPEQNRRREVLRMLRIRIDYERQAKYEHDFGIASRQKEFEDQTDAITERRLKAERLAEATCRDAQAGARERADAERGAAEESYENDLAAKLAKADPEVRELLKRLNPRLRDLREVVAA
jgi:hypothetical protein